MAPVECPPTKHDGYEAADYLLFVDRCAVGVIGAKKIGTTLTHDESLEDAANLPEPAVRVAKIIEKLESALAEFEAVASALRGDEAIEDDAEG